MRRSGPGFTGSNGPTPGRLSLAPSCGLSSNATHRTNIAAWRAEHALVTIAEINEGAQATLTFSPADRRRQPLIALWGLRHGPTFMSRDGAR